MSDSELPNELDKLKIAPTQVKLVDSQLLNPFYKDVGIEDCVTTKLAMPGNRNSGLQNCRRCRLRRRSESTLDDYKDNLATTSTTQTQATSCERSTPGVVHRLSFKKTAFGNSRKSIMREPLLQALQTCFHVSSKRLPGATENNSVETLTLSNDAYLASKGADDFRDLISDCNNLLKYDDAADFSSRLNQINLSQHSSKKFTIMQTPNAKTRIHRNIGCADDAAASKHVNKTCRNATSNRGNITTAVTRTTTTCSQQAGNSQASSVADDVTIDELASYFDTLVHIPKKMSVSAEMMYI